MQPQPCFGCRRPVEALRVGDHNVVFDRRLPERVSFFGPALCWECRGVIMLNPPIPAPGEDEEAFVLLVPGFAGGAISLN